MYEIRLCRIDEKERLKQFIFHYWNERHIFISHDHILDFQHKEKFHYNFVVAYHVETASFHGVLGFISPTFYSKGYVEPDDDLWLALWKVEKSLAESNSLGLDMLGFLETKYLPKSISAIGINKQVALLYRLLGFKVGTMKQWFIANDRLKNFKIATLQKPSNIISKQNHKSSVSVVKSELGEICKIIRGKQIAYPNKSCEYLQNRYEKHPTYDYEYYKVITDTNILALLIGRRVSTSNASAFRVTDIFFWSCYDYSWEQAIVSFLVQENLEYLDLLIFGDVGIYPERLGFLQNSIENYVPHLFEPFVREQCEVMVAYKTNQFFGSFKGDSDLDRPNQ